MCYKICIDSRHHNDQESYVPWLAARIEAVHTRFEGCSIVRAHIERLHTMAFLNRRNTKVATVQKGKPDRALVKHMAARLQAQFHLRHPKGLVQFEHNAAARGWNKPTTQRHLLPGSTSPVIRMLVEHLRCTNK